MLMQSCTKNYQWFAKVEVTGVAKVFSLMNFVMLAKFTDIFTYSLQYRAYVNISTQ